MLLSLAVFCTVGGLSLASVAEKVLGAPVPHIQITGTLLFILLGMILFLYPLLRSRAFLSKCCSYVFAVFVLLVSFLAFSSPWMTRNMFLNKKIGIQAMLNAPNTITPWIRHFPEEITPDAPPWITYLSTGTPRGPESRTVQRNCKT